MKQLLSLGIAGAALVAMTVPADAQRERERGGGRGAAMRAQGQARAVQQAPRMQQPRAAMQQPRATARIQQPRATANVQRQAVNRQATMNARTQAMARNRAALSARTRTTQPSVAFGGQTRAERRDRSTTIDRSDLRRTARGDFRDRDYRDRDRRDRDWDRGDYRFRRPPGTVWRNWDRGRVHTWNNHRWHWYNNAWVIVGAAPNVVYYDYDYDEPYVSTYISTSGSTVAEVQRELAREGYDPGPIDGVLGGQTRSAIAAFQADNGLAATGSIDSATLSELGLN